MRERERERVRVRGWGGRGSLLLVAQIQRPHDFFGSHHLHCVLQRNEGANARALFDVASPHQKPPKNKNAAKNRFSSLTPSSKNASYFKTRTPLSGIGSAEAQPFILRREWQKRGRFLLSKSAKNQLPDYNKNCFPPKTICTVG